ncbi:acyl-CoA Delta-12 desaturase [Hylaeus volcanicus]|uniref:acyl-CoA Delta-12 desaturase n=1 Tax=Hylaeus volcanicus TaxID=313075 RepID=UPI0023B7BAB2|nr:acyl-CoA Delta-12 desaturase [Hylaeus volcanicus]XP_053980729.1 acyl-CoA Delta-12 desaturase [Hylaeus volcanicus]
MSSEKTKSVKKQEVKWAAVLWYIHLHVLGIYAIWLLITSAKWMTVFFTLFITAIGSLGVTTAHRYWAHRTFEATSSLRLFLMLAHTLAGVGPIYDWVLYHRLHHKYHGTDKDPFNHKKGFLYSHYVGNFVSPNVDYEQAKIEVDMRDMEIDGYIWIQKKFYWLLFGIIGLLLPLNAPLEYWDESLPTIILTVGILRFAITTNMSWLVNSALMVWGVKGSKIPLNNFTVFFLKRSYWPAYHYMVPWDWKSGEFGKYDAGCTTFFIKVWYELGLVKMLLTPSTEDVRDMVHQLSEKKMSMEDGIEKLKELAIYNAKSEVLRYL